MKRLEIPQNAYEPGPVYDHLIALLFGFFSSC